MHCSRSLQSEGSQRRPPLFPPRNPGMKHGADAGRMGWGLGLCGTQGTAGADPLRNAAAIARSGARAMGSQLGGQIERVVLGSISAANRTALGKRGRVSCTIFRRTYPHPACLQLDLAAAGRYADERTEPA